MINVKKSCYILIINTCSKVPHNMLGHLLYRINKKNVLQTKGKIEVIQPDMESYSARQSEVFTIDLNKIGPMFVKSI